MDGYPIALRRTGLGLDRTLYPPQRGERDRRPRAGHHQRQGARTDHVRSADQGTGGDRADELAEGGADGEVAEVAVVFVRRGLAGHQGLGADHEREMAEAHHAAPHGHRHQRVRQSAHDTAAGYEDDTHGQQGAQRPWSVLRPSGTAANSGSRA